MAQSGPSQRCAARIYAAVPRCKWPGTVTFCWFVGRVMKASMSQSSSSLCLQAHGAVSKAAATCCLQGCYALGVPWSCSFSLHAEGRAVAAGVVRAHWPGRRARRGGGRRRRAGARGMPRAVPGAVPGRGRCGAVRTPGRQRVRGHRRAHGAPVGKLGSLVRRTQLICFCALAVLHGLPVCVPGSKAPRSPRR